MTRDYRELEIMRRNIQSFKEKHDKTNQDIARALDVNKSHITRIMNGETVPSLPFAIELARYMGQSLRELFTQADEERQAAALADSRKELLHIVLSGIGLEPTEVQSTIEYITKQKDSRP